MGLHKTTSLAVAAALALGGVGTATAAFANDEPTTRAIQAPSPALPGAERVAEQNRVLSNTSGAIQPVTELIQDVVRTTDGNLSQEAAQEHTTSVQRSLAKIRTQAQQADSQGAQRDQARESQTPAGEETAGEAASDKATVKAVDQLRDQVEKLLNASTSGEPAKVNAQLESTVTAMVNLMTSVVLSDALPDATMTGLPQQPGEVDGQDGSEQGAPMG